MSRTLYLQLDARWPLEHSDCPWYLIDGDKACTHGRDASAQWPQATEHVAVLAPDQVVYHQVKLPPGVNWRDVSALAMALEDRLLDELSSVVVVPLRQHGDEVVCCTLQRRRLEELLAVMQDLGRPLLRIESLAEGLPNAAEAWQIVQYDEGPLWLHDGRSVLALDLPLDGSVPVALTLRHAQASDSPPARVILHGLSPTLLRDLESEWGIPVQRTPAPNWHATLHPPRTNLLVGDFVPRRKLWAESVFRTSAMVIAACVAIQLLMTVASLGKTWWSIHQTRAEQLAFWQEVAGSSEPTHQPALRLHQMWQSARTRVGESRADEFVPMLAVLAQQLPQSHVNKIDFQQGRLVVVWSGTPQDARLLEAGIRQRGYTAVTQSANNGVVTTAFVAKENP